MQFKLLDLRLHIGVTAVQLPLTHLAVVTKGLTNI